ncbi:MAG: hypothetical protein ACFFD2_15530 [Promethearchaeota archaeon]
MAHKEWVCIGLLIALPFIMLGLILGNLFPNPYQTIIWVTFAVIGLFLLIFISFFARPIYMRFKKKPFFGDQKYLICPECNIQVEKESGVCPKCGKNLLYSSKIETE